MSEFTIIIFYSLTFEHIPLYFTITLMKALKVKIIHMQNTKFSEQIFQST